MENSVFERFKKLNKTAEAMYSYFSKKPRNPRGGVMDMVRLQEGLETMFPKQPFDRQTILKNMKYLEDQGFGILDLSGRNPGFVWKAKLKDLLSGLVPVPANDTVPPRIRNRPQSLPPIPALSTDSLVYQLAHLLTESLPKLSDKEVELLVGLLRLRLATGPTKQP